MVELKACPFCGGEAELRGHKAPEFWVGCSKMGCKATTEGFGDQERAIAAWNTRPTDTDADVEQSAQNWIEATYANYNFDPADSDYSTDDLVDAFMAGHTTLQARVDALEGENARLRGLLASQERISDAVHSALWDADRAARTGAAT